MYFGPVEDGPAALADIRHEVTPAVDLRGPVPYVELQRSVGEANPRGVHSYARAERLAGLSDDTIASLVAYAGVPSSTMNQILLHPMGGTVARVDRHATAFAYRERNFPPARGAEGDLGPGPRVAPQPELPTSDGVKPRLAADQPSATVRCGAITAATWRRIQSWMSPAKAAMASTIASSGESVRSRAASNASAA